MKRWTVILSMLLVAMLSLQGCGGGGGSDSSPSKELQDLVDEVEKNNPTPVVPGTTTGDSAAEALSIAFAGGSSSTTLIADGSDNSTVRVAVTDGSGNPVPGEAVFFYCSAGSFSPSETVLTDSDGIASAVYVGTGNLGTATLWAKVGGIRSEDLSVQFTAGPPAQLTLIAAPLTVNQNGTASVEATVQDVNGNPVEGETVRFAFTTNETGGKSDIVLAVTDANGRASVSYTAGSKSGSDVISATTTNGTTSSATIKVNSELSKSFAIELQRSTSTPLSLGGTDTITATITDDNGDPVADNTPVDFSVTGVGTVSNTVLTQNGIAQATFNAGMSAGIATITATSGTASNSIIVEVKPGEAGSIEVDGIDPDNATIHILGTVADQTATISFRVLDGFGNPVADNTPVEFSLPHDVDGNTVLNGGESISTGGAFGSTAGGLTTNGIAAVNLRAGTVAGTVDVIATVRPPATSATVSTLARVTIVGGQPDSKHFSLSAEYLNVAGGVYDGLQDEIYAYIGDRFGNVPKDGTPVSFYSECGTIGDSTGFIASTLHGMATSHLHTLDPMTPDLAGIDVGGDGVLVNNPGLCTIMAQTAGSEFFEDNNGNGVFDTGDNCTGDLGEPFIDANGNGAFDAGEFYVDVNKNQAYNGPDGTCQENTMIWTSMQVLMSDYARPINLTPAAFALQVGEAQTFSVDFADLYGNALVAGTSIAVETTAGELGGLESHVQADTTGEGNYLAGGNPFTFTLFSDMEQDAEPKLAKVTVTLTPPETGDQGNNGATQTVTIAGYINLPPPAQVVVDSVEARSGAEQLIADGSSTTTIRAIAKDAADNPVEGAEVYFSSADGTILTPMPVVTNASGVADATFQAGFTSGTATVTATSQGFSGTATLELQPNVPGIVSLTPSPDTVKPGGTSAVTVLVTDNSQNPITEESVTLSLSSNQTGAKLDQVSVKTDENGLATVNYTAGSNLQASIETDIITATTRNGIAGTATVTVSSSALVIGEVSVQSSLSSLVADGVEQTTVSALVKDETNNPAPGVMVTFASSSGSFPGGPFLTGANGVAAATFTSGTLAGTAEIVAVAGGVAGSTEISLTAGSPGFISLLASPASVKPGGTSTLTAEVKDANGNLVSGETVSFTIPVDSTLASLDSPTAVTDSQGRASVQYTAGFDLQNATETDTLRAVTSNNFSVTTDIGVSSQAVVVNDIIAQVGAASLTADGTSTTTVKATVQDADGNPAPAVEVTFFADQGAFSPATVMTNVNGEAQSVFTAGTVAGPATIAVSASGVYAIGVLELVADAPASVTLNAAPDQVVPGGTSSLTATVLDVNGNPVVGQSVAFAVSADISGASLGAASAITNASGQATVAYTAGAVSGNDAIIASAAGVNSAPETIAVDVASVVVNAISVSSGSSELPADGLTQSAIRAQVTDIEGGPAVGVTVNFTTTLGTILASTITDTRGSAEVFLTADTVTGSAVVTAEANGFAASTTLEMIAGAPADVVVSAVPSTIVPEGSSVVTASVSDANGNPVSGHTVTFSISTNNTGGTLGSVTAVTNADGRAVAAYIGGSSAGNDTITAKATDSVTGTGTVTVSAGAGLIGGISVQPGSSEVVADGTREVTVQATVVDVDGLPFSGVNVTFMTTLGDYAGSAVTSVATNADGVARATLTAPSRIGTADISVEAGGLFAYSSIDFIADVPSLVEVSAWPQTVLALGDDPADSQSTIVATIKDANGNPVKGTTVFFASAGVGAGGTTLTPLTAETDADGRATTIFTAGDGAGTYDIDATTSNGSSSNPDAQVVVNASATGAAVSDLILAASKYTVSTSGAEAVMLKVTAVDGSNAAVEGALIAFSADAGLLGAPSVTTGADGTGSVTFSAGGEKENQVVTVEATSGVVTENLPLTLSGTTINLTADRTSTTTGGPTIQLTGSVIDGGGNPVVGEDLVLTSSAGNSLNGAAVPLTLTTDVAGGVTASFDGAFIGVDTLSLAGLGAQKDLQITVDNSSFGFTSHNENDIVDVTTVESLVVTWLDQNGAPVVGETVTFAASPGTLAADTAVTDGAGQATVNFTTSNIAAPATVTVTSPPAFGLSDSLTLDVRAVLPDRLDLQAEPSVIGTSIGEVNSTSTLTATVRDGNNIAVAGALVRFVITEGPGGGEYLSSITATTDATGQATTTFVAGGAASAQDGVEVTATVDGFPGVVGRANLTIGQQAARIVFGTTNRVGTLTSNGLEIGYSWPVTVLVTDNNGSPIANQTVNLGIYPLRFYLGSRVSPTNSASSVRTGYFFNEDLNQNGILDNGEDGARGFYDFNGDGTIDTLTDADGDLIADEAAIFVSQDEVERDLGAGPVGVLNGRLDPGNIASIPAEITTDENGMAGFEVVYAKSHANWAEVRLSAATSVSGSETRASLEMDLPEPLADFPYLESPFGL